MSTTSSSLECLAACSGLLAYMQQPPSAGHRPRQCRTLQNCICHHTMKRPTCRHAYKLCGKMSRRAPQSGSAAHCLVASRHCPHTHTIRAFWPPPPAPTPSPRGTQGRPQPRRHHSQEHVRVHTKATHKPSSGSGPALHPQSAVSLRPSTLGRHAVCPVMPVRRVAPPCSHEAAAMHGSGPGGRSDVEVGPVSGGAHLLELLHDLGEVLLRGGAGGGTGGGGAAAGQCQW